MTDGQRPDQPLSTVPWWSSEDLWRKAAIWVAAGMAVILIVLTFDPVSRISAGGERAMGGSSWSAFFEGQTHPWFIQAMYWRNIFGWITTAGLLLLFWDFLTIGQGERRAIKEVRSLQELATSQAT